jgi:hypothetical protein
MATSAAQYQQISTTSVLPEVTQFDSAYRNLGNVLGAG